MILSRFFKPKWQHAKPEIRRQAISALASDDPALRQLAEHDPALEVRQVALVRLGDLEARYSALRSTTKSHDGAAASAAARTRTDERAYTTRPQPR